jgi:hypothetical protein
MINKIRFISLCLALIVLQSCAQAEITATPTTQRIIEVFSTAESIQILGSDRDESLIDLAQNKRGEFAIAGTTDGAIDGYPNRLSDAFVAKYDRDGNKQWVVRFGTPQDDFATAVAISDDGEVWVSGDTYGGMQLNANKGERDGFLAKFSATGVQLWVVHISTEVIERARGLAVDARGIATVVGTTYGEFPGFSNAGKSREAWITQIDSNGKRVWLQQFGSDQADTIVDVSVDEEGNSTICGYTDSVIGQEFFGIRDAFIGKFTSSGEKSWIYQFGTSSTDICYGQWVDARGNVFAVGVTEGIISGTKNFGLQDGWVLKLSQDGKFLWLTQVGTSGVDGLAKVTTNSAGQVIVGGVSKGDLTNAVTVGGEDAIIFVLNANGTEVGKRMFGTVSNDGVNGIAVTESQEILVAGTTGAGILGSVGLGELDVFIARFMPLSGGK